MRFCLKLAMAFLIGSLYYAGAGWVYDHVQIDDKGFRVTAAMFWPVVFLPVFCGYLIIDAYFK